MNEAPERVWIVEGFIVPDDIHDPEQFDETEYVRADIAKATIARLTRENKRLDEELAWCLQVIIKARASMSLTKWKAITQSSAALAEGE